MEGLLLLLPSLRDSRSKALSQTCKLPRASQFSIVCETVLTHPTSLHFAARLNRPFLRSVQLLQLLKVNGARSWAGQLLQLLLLGLDRLPSFNEPSSRSPLQFLTAKVTMPRSALQ